MRQVQHPDFNGTARVSDTLRVFTWNWTGVMYLVYIQHLHTEYEYMFRVARQRSTLCTAFSSSGPQPPVVCAGLSLCEGG